MIADRLRHNVGELFFEQHEADTATAATLPTIIEVPRWLARLEPQLASLDRDESVQVEKPPKPITSEQENALLKQRELF